MAQFYAAVMTNSGAALLAEAIAGKARIQFTTLNAGDGEYSEAERTVTALQAMTSLKSQKQSVGFSSIVVESETSVHLTGVLDNEGMVESYYVREVGIYAKNVLDDEAEPMLYSIAVAQVADYMPPYNGLAPTTIIQEYFATVDNSAEVTFEAGTGVYALADDLERLSKQKLDKTGDSGNTTANYTSNDTISPSEWKNFKLFTGLEKVKEFFAKVSTMGSNIRYLWKLMESTDMLIDALTQQVADNAETAKDYTDVNYKQSTGYTDQKIADLINGAPTTLDTLGEIAKAMADNENVVKALEDAIGKKANQSEMESLLNTKLEKTGDAASATVTFSQASTRENIASKETLATILGKAMKWFADLANGAATTLLGTNLTENRALVSNSSGKVAASAVTATELGYLDGATDNIQNQIDSLNSNLARIESKITSKRVTSSNNLDDIVDNGVYWCSSDDVPKNCPYTIAVIIEVFGGESTTTRTIQRVTTYSGTIKTACRGLVGDTWGSWREYTTTAMQ